MCRQLVGYNKKQRAAESKQRRRQEDGYPEEASINWPNSPEYDPSMRIP
jgi:hypothetical protein